MAQPRVVMSPEGVFNSGEAAVALRQAGNWLKMRSKMGK